jgi:hypothetical protein
MYQYIKDHPIEIILGVTTIGLSAVGMYYVGYFAAMSMSAYTAGYIINTAELVITDLRKLQINDMSPEDIQKVAEIIDKVSTISEEALI